MATKTTKTGKNAKANKPANKASKGKKATKAAAAPVKPQVAAQAAGKPFNPYRPSSSYWAVVEALAQLGLGKMHAHEAIAPAIRKQMGGAFKTFAAKEARNEETHLDANKRLIVNVSVVARADYGKKLRENGYEVRFDGKAKEAGLFKM